ncbi:NAD-dependent epimerase [Agarivorans sp. MS3-6]|uniref:NAD-dependent epimerase n=1 Tax=Agarivorans sp. TSD2052 TaxID=2937286 RepID=UPI00200FE641|nr:NAD-dependent epimerase [Agarivorans sp. TSD2052]UPW20085.1 NAD-dependent epimerase [Agarivorans sp. TSD2052]
MKYLVTGAAGFIGFHVARRLCAEGHEVVGIDNLNNYYDVNLKLARLEQLKNYDHFNFYSIDLFDREAIDQLFAEQQFQRVIHLGAQAGVRYSLENPHRYADANLAGHIDILEGCSKYKVEHLVYASSSSVYGMNNKMPFSVKDPVDHPVSLYAATKRANELTSHTYSHLFGLPTTGLRFFTVYGPWGRPDMAPFKFTKAILDGDTIDIYNNGDLSRDFTYIDDIVEGVMRIQALIPTDSQHSDFSFPNQSTAPYALYNIGNGAPVKLMDFVKAIEDATGIPAKKNYLPMQAGDVYHTWADTSELYQATGYKPKVAINEGVRRFVDWYKDYYSVH